MHFAKIRIVQVGLLIFLGLQASSLGLVSGLAVCSSQERRQTVQQAEDAFAFNRRDFRDDRVAGFKAAIKLIKRAKDSAQPPSTIARLHYEAARLKRMMWLTEKDDDDYRTAVSMLRVVVHRPEEYLVDYPSAQWFRNCLGLLTAIYGDTQTEYELIAEEIASALKAVQDSKRLTAIETRLIENGIRMAASDVAIGQEDWQAAIEWVEPVIESADDLLTNDGVSSLAMSTRQQSMFLANAGQELKSSELIDSICNRIESAENIDEYLKLTMKCMLRGKHLINFPNDRTQDFIADGWKKYHSLSSQVEAYQGKRKPVVLRSLLNMHRLACCQTKDVNEKLGILRAATKVVESTPELGDVSFGAMSSYHEIADRTLTAMKQAGDLRTDIVQKEVLALLKSLDEGRVEKLPGTKRD